MQHLFVGGLASMVFGALAMLAIGHISGSPDTAGLYTFMFMIVFGMLIGVSAKKDNIGQMIIGSVVMIYAIAFASGQFLMLFLKDGFGLLLLVLGSAIMLSRAAGIGFALQKEPRRPEKFWNSFIGALPLVGVPYSFIVMWGRATQEPPSSPPQEPPAEPQQ